MGSFNFGVRIFLLVLSWYVLIVRMVCSSSQYNFIVITICTILYHIEVRICVQRIMIILLHWHKYSAPPATLKIVVTSESYCRPEDLNWQWRCHQSVACYRRYLHPNPNPYGSFSPSVPSIQLQENLSHYPSKCIKIQFLWSNWSEPIWYIRFTSRVN